MKFVKTLLFLFALIISGTIVAQDIHWTMFNMSPLTLNPANTGAFEGTFRIGGIYRDQWNSISGADGFRTPSIYVDAPLVRGFRKNDWVGVGGYLYTDEAGRAQLQTTATMGSIAYHLSLDKKSTTYLTIGAQGGMVQRQIDTESITTGTQIVLGSDPVPFSQSQEATNIGADERHLDFNVGVMITSQLNKTMDFNLGLAFKHITTPEYSFMNTGVAGSQEELPMLITAHGTFNVDLNDKWMLSPSFIFNTMAKHNEIGLQGLLGYHFNQDMTLRFGPGYRLGDAAEVIVGFDYKQFKVGAAYDINVSDLDVATNNQGGFEIAVSYIARIFKQPTVKPVIFCPKF